MDHIVKGPLFGIKPCMWQEGASPGAFVLLAWIKIFVPQTQFLSSFYQIQIPNFAQTGSVKCSRHVEDSLWDVFKAAGMLVCKVRVVWGFGKRFSPNTPPFSESDC